MLPRSETGIGTSTPLGLVRMVEFGEEQEAESDQWSYMDWY